jgi:peptide/nickel transport system substrate-binding protein
VSHLYPEARRTTRRLLPARTALVGVVAASAVLLAGCATGADVAPDDAVTPVESIVIGLNGYSDTAGFNQDIAYDGGSQFAASLIYSRLTVMDYGPDFEIHPQLATDWEVSDDATTYTFHLDENATWHDGEPVTSADVEMTFEGIVEQGGPAKSLLNLESIETPDEHTVVITLAAPDAGFLYSISVYPRTSILPAHLYEGTDWKTNPANLEPIGSGPYKFESLAAGQQYILTANEDYFGGVPNVAKVAFQFVPNEQTALAGLRSGELDALGFPPSLTLQAELASDPGLEVDAPSGPWAAFVGFSAGRELVADPQVRQAISLAIDRQAIVDRVTGGIATASTGSFIDSTPWAVNPDALYPATDVDGAIELLEDAGYTEDANGVRLTLSMLVSSVDFYPDVAETLREQLAEIGVALDLQLVDRPTFIANAKLGQTDLIIDALWIGPDPNEWAQQIGTGGAYNRFNYSNPEIDALFAEGRSSADREIRAESYYAIQDILLEEMPYTNIFAAPYSFVHSADLTGWFSDQGTISYRLDITQVTAAG